MIAGKDNGKTGKVLRVDPKKRPGLRRGPEHRQAPPAPAARPARTRQVGVIEKEGPIHISNVVLIDPKDKKPTRVGVTPRRERQAHARRRSAPGRSSTDHGTPQETATSRRSARSSMDELRLLVADAGAEDREDHAQHGRRARPSRTPRCSRPPRSSSRRSPARSRTSAARASRSPHFKLREGMPVGLSVTLRERARVRVPRPPDRRSRSRGSATSAA